MARMIETKTKRLNLANLLIKFFYRTKTIPLLASCIHANLAEGWVKSSFL